MKTRSLLTSLLLLIAMTAAADSPKPGTGAPDSSTGPTNPQVQVEPPSWAYCLLWGTPEPMCHNHQK